MNDELLKNSVPKDCVFKEIKRIYSLNLFLVYFKNESNFKLYLNIIFVDQANGNPFTIDCSHLEKLLDSKFLDVMMDLAISDRKFDSNYKFSNEEYSYRMYCPSVFEQIREPYVKFFARLNTEDEERFCFSLKQDNFNLLYGYLETRLISECRLFNR